MSSSLSSLAAAGLDVLTVGRVGVDLYPEQSGVPLAEVRTFAKFLGGTATNVAVGAARLGHPSAVLTKVGPDGFGDFVRTALRGFGVELTLGQQLTVMFVSILGGIGTAGVPAGSLPVVALICAMVGVPPEGIGLILGVDRFLDMCRTTLNVTGDLMLATVVSKGEAEGEPGAA